MVLESRAWLAHEADNLTAICDPVFTACYDSFTLILLYDVPLQHNTIYM
jgi:hypothetical protein